MAKSSASQWIPSGGVLAVAIGAGLLAAILVNVYLGVVKSQYEYGSKTFFVLKENVDMGNPIQQRSLEAQQIPKPLLPAFEAAKAIAADEKGMTIIGRKAPRDLKKGTFLWWPDFIATEAGTEANIPKGYERITVRVDPTSSLGQQLQPGSYVNIRGLFDINNDLRNPNVQSLDVIKNVQVRGINGTPGGTALRGEITNIQILVPTAVAKQLLQIQGMLKSRDFAIGEVPTPEATSTSEPKIEKEVLALMNRPRGSGTAAGATPPPPETIDGRPGPAPVVP
jgi:Flp pilus assembly protein CpaB